jgi:hypothetical protein
VAEAIKELLVGRPFPISALALALAAIDICAGQDSELMRECIRAGQAACLSKRMAFGDDPRVALAYISVHAVQLSAGSVWLNWASYKEKVNGR